MKLLGDDQGFERICLACGRSNLCLMSDLMTDPVEVWISCNLCGHKTFNCFRKSTQNAKE